LESYFWHYEIPKHTKTRRGTFDAKNCACMFWILNLNPFKIKHKYILICVHVFMHMTLLVSTILGANLVAHNKVMVGVRINVSYWKSCKLLLFFMFPMFYVVWFLFTLPLKVTKIVYCQSYYLVVRTPEVFFWVLGIFDWPITTIKIN
jgi:hypothetical protein